MATTEPAVVPTDVRWLAAQAQLWWPDLQVDCVGQLVRGGGEEVVFSARRRGLQFRASSVADVERYMGPRLPLVQLVIGPLAAAPKAVQKTLF